MNKVKDTHLRKRRMGGPKSPVDYIKKLVLKQSDDAPHIYDIINEPYNDFDATYDEQHALLKIKGGHDAITSSSTSHEIIEIMAAMEDIMAIYQYLKQLLQERNVDFVVREAEASIEYTIRVDMELHSEAFTIVKPMSIEDFYKGLTQNEKWAMLLNYHMMYHDIQEDSGILNLSEDDHKAIDEHLESINSKTLLYLESNEKINPDTL